MANTGSTHTHSLLIPLPPPFWYVPKFEWRLLVSLYALKPIIPSRRIVWRVEYCIGSKKPSSITSLPLRNVCPPTPVHLHPQLFPDVSCEPGSNTLFVPSTYSTVPNLNHYYKGELPLRRVPLRNALLELKPR